MSEQGFRTRSAVSRLASHYGMAGVLLLLCLYYSWATVRPQQATGEPAAETLAAEVAAAAPQGARVLIVARQSPEDAAFADALQRLLEARGLVVVGNVKGEPPDARAALESIAAGGGGLNVIAASRDAAQWAVFDRVLAEKPSLSGARVMSPGGGRWPTFLTTSNLLNVAGQAVIFALLAAGMTLVIITGGIDLSVGSLVALSAVVSTLLIRRYGGAAATTTTMVVACAAGVVACAAAGAVNGGLVTLFQIPPFIATLGMMLLARGQAYARTNSESVYDVPDAFTWLGRGTTFGGVPNGVLLMLVVYAAVHVLMSRTTLGRYVYAVGGNAEAARLSGVRVKRVLMFVYTLSGALAGLGGVVLASQLKSGAPTYGMMYELDAIAAVVVGGTSLAGGSGRVVSSLIGALIIAVIRNGMNLTGVRYAEQMEVMGLVLLAAVIFDSFRRRGWRFGAAR